MPNWCENVLSVEAPSAERLAEVKELLFGDAGHLTLSGTVPEPKDFSGYESKNGYEGLPDWYNWRLDNWGTKWNISESTVAEMSDTEFVISFDSAWAPPATWLSKTAVLFPDVRWKLHYMEPGADFSGSEEYFDGELIFENDYDYLDLGIWLEMGYEVSDYAPHLLRNEALLADFIASPETNPSLLNAVIAYIDSDDIEDYELPEESVVESLRKAASR